MLDRAKRIVVGRALRDDGNLERPLPKRQALPAFAADALSSNAYATEEMLLVLTLGGFALYSYGPAMALLVGIVFVVVVVSYRQVVRAFPGGGGDYEAASATLGPRAGALAAAASLVDMALTLAVSISAATATLISVLPGLVDLRVPIAVAAIAAMTLINLRGVRGTNPVFVVGTYAFVAAIALMTLVAAIRLFAGESIRAQSADWTLANPSTLTGVAVLLLLVRGFASGSIAVTGVESIGTAVPSFRSPRGRNASWALGVLGVISMLLFAAITWLAYATQVRISADPTKLLGPPPDYVPQTLIVQVAEAVFKDWAFLAVLVVVTTILILVAAANSAFRGFSALASRLGNDGLIPKQFHTRGNRLVFSNGVLLLGAAAVLTVLLSGADLATLLQLYIVGVFLALALGQAAMVRHWTNRLGRPGTPDVLAEVRRARRIARVGLLTTATVLVAALVGKLLTGAWIIVLVITVLYIIMRAINTHYQRVSADSAAPDSTVRLADLRGEQIAVVLVGHVHKPTLRALAYARAARPTRLEAVTVAVNEEESTVLRREWSQANFTVPLTVLASPYRDLESPVVKYLQQLRAEQPEALLSVYVPEYLVTRWWQRYLHNQTAGRLKRSLSSLSRVSVVSVPWRITAGAQEPAETTAP